MTMASGIFSGATANTVTYDVDSTSFSGATAAIRTFSKHYEQAVQQAKEDDSRFLDNLNDVTIVRDDGVNFMSAIVDQRHQLVWMSAETYTTIMADEDASWDMETSIQDWPSGMKYLMEETHYRAAQERRTDLEVPTKDVLGQLEEDARSLLVSVATAQGEMSELQMQVFAERLADVQGRLGALMEHLERVESHIELAAVALLDTQ